MPEYVYALHNFAPENDDEIAFRVGQPIEVVEKDDLYNDGWWKGRNIDGKTGLFPQSYTTSAPPPAGVSTSHSTSSSDPITTPPDSLSPLGEENESTSLHDAETESRIGIAIGEPEGVDTEVMKATMTDVQKAIEQLGRSDRDGAQSFSFSSTRDGDTDRETDGGTETDGEIGEGWHRSARDKLAEQARKVVEAQAAKEALEARDIHARASVPPIDVEMSDESDAEADDTAFRRLQNMHFTRDHPHIPEEEEEAEARRTSAARNSRPKNSNATSPAVFPKDDFLSPNVENGGRTASANRSSFTTISSPPRSTRSPVSIGRRSPKLRSTPTTPDAINIVSPVPVMPMNVHHMIPVSTSPDPAVRRTPTPSVTRDIPTALPSPAFTASGTRQHSRQPSQQTSVSSVGRGSAVLSSQSAPETNAQNQCSASDWTVDEVVDWLKAKGFGPDVYDRFIEQEITGDVLLELDVNLLKTEIGIAAFGKRMRIANAVLELRRPSSVISGDHQPHHSTSQSFSSYANSPSGSTHPSLNSPMFASLLNGQPSSTFTGPGSFESPKAEAFASPLITKRVSSFSSTGASVNGGGSAEGIVAVAAGIEKVGSLGVAGLGLRALPETRSISSPSNINRVLTPPDTKPELEVIADQDRDAESEMSVEPEPEPEPAATKQHGMRLLGHLGETPGTGKDKEKSDFSFDAKRLASPTETPRLVRRESQDDANSSVTAKIARLNKRSAEVTKGPERHSLFGGTLPSIGRSRKPAPRVTSTLLEESSPTEKTSTLNLSRLYSSRKSSRPSTADGSTSSILLRNGLRSGSESDAKKKDAESAKSLRELERTTPKVKSMELRDTSPSQKRASMPDVRAGARGPNALKPGKSIVEQIGQPDHQGWLRKKGDRYNSWKLRYFIIKGPHLYILRSNSKSETKIKGYVNIVGYKVVADENIDPGRYGFRIVHETDKTHFFSSDEQAVVREWMKAVMKATIGRDYSKPVVSSVNIPTIPLTVAQAMNPAPRPPSPTARAATQKALRRENPNQLSTRDARILMGLPSSDNTTSAGRPSDVQMSERPRSDTSFSNQPADASERNGSLITNFKNTPPRPTRETRRRNVPSQDSLIGVDSNLVEWANSHLPRSLQVIDPVGPLFDGLAILRLAEDMMGKSATPPIPDSAFPSGPKDDKLDGLFRLFDFLLDNDVKMGSVSINDVRQGKRDKVMQLLKALKSWEDRRKEILKSLGQGPITIPSGPVIGPVIGNGWR